MANLARAAEPTRDFVLEEIIQKASRSLEYYCKIFHPGRFTRPFSRNHYRYFEAIDDSSIQQLLIIAHRGWGKTSSVNFAVPAREIVLNGVGFGLTGELVIDKSARKFIVPASATANSAELQGENLKKSLRANVMVKGLIGDIKTEDAFARDAWETSNGVYLLPRGVGQQVRGILYHDNRPDLLIADDLEKSDEVMTSEQRQKLKRWFFTDFLNTVDRSKDSWRVVVVGTILHEDSLLENLREDTANWTTLDLPLCDENYKSYWPQFMPDEKIEKLVNQYRTQHMLAEFAREYMNTSTPSEDAVFKEDYFKKYNESQPYGDGKAYDLSNPDLDTVIIMDPAKTEKMHNAYSAVVGITLDVARHRIFVRDVVNEHLTPDGIYEQVFGMAERLKARVIAFEVTGLNEFIRQPMWNEMLRRGKSYELVELHARSAQQGDYESKGSHKGKAARIAMLAPYYRTGAIYHNDSGVCNVLEQQLLSFPRSKHWDVMDALSYVVELMEQGDRYFSEEAESQQLAREAKELEDEYDVLLKEDEEPLSFGVYV